MYFCIGVITLDINIGDKLLMKKKHPCGVDTFTVTRIGMDFKIRCDGCGHEVMVPRAKCEKNIKKVIKGE
jgi:hypothetical protein